MLGDYDSRDDNEMEQLLVKVSGVESHPNYRTYSHKNDIAIIKLSRKVHFNVFIQPICLPSPTLRFPTNENFKCFVSGWGYRDVNSGKHSSILQDIQIPLVDDQKCKQTYKDKITDELLESMFCAGDGKQDSCQGDSGGPLVCRSR